MTVGQWLLALLGFGLYAGVSLAHPRAGAAVASIGHARSIEAPPQVESLAAERKVEAELRPMRVETASSDPPGSAVPKPVRPRKRRPRHATSFDASDGRAILETGIRPAVIETAPAR
jgi:hypothetical protein